MPGDSAQSDMGYIGGQAARGGGAGGGGGGRQRRRHAARAPAAGGGAAGAVPSGCGGCGRGGRQRRGGADDVQGLPLMKPPYDRITAYDMNTGEIVWQKTHASTPDDIRNHPALRGLNLPRLGQPGRTFIGTLTTKNAADCGRRRRAHQ